MKVSETRVQVLLMFVVFQILSHRVNMMSKIKSKRHPFMPSVSAKRRYDLFIKTLETRVQVPLSLVVFEAQDHRVNIVSNITSGRVPICSAAVEGAPGYWL